MVHVQDQPSSPALAADDCTAKVQALLASSDGRARLDVAQEIIDLIRDATPWSGTPQEAHVLARSVAEHFGETSVSFWLPAY